MRRNLWTLPAREARPWACCPRRTGGTDAHLVPHARANLTVGNTKPTQVAALVHCYPYIGFPRAVNAIRVVAGLADYAES
jgi:4-carboxymuconolactone decarboxylase